MAEIRECLFRIDLLHREHHRRELQVVVADDLETTRSRERGIPGGIDEGASRDREAPFPRLDDDPLEAAVGEAGMREPRVQKRLQIRLASDQLVQQPLHSPRDVGEGRGVLNRNRPVRESPVQQRLGHLQREPAHGRADRAVPVPQVEPTVGPDRAAGTHASEEGHVLDEERTEAFARRRDGGSAAGRTAARNQQVGLGDDLDLLGGSKQCLHSVLTDRCRLMIAESPR
jgi:hypothetical protein